MRGTDGRYTVRDGDTLQGIAASVWGDASLWYMIAEANGLSGSESLAAGSSLIIPDKVVNLHNSSKTFEVYDPNRALGDLSPTAAKPPKKANKCGMLGAIMLVAVGIAVTVITAGAALAALSPAVGSIGAGITAMATGMAASGAAIGFGTMAAAGAIGGVMGSIASQGLGVATGLQDKFSWKGVAMAGISGAVSAGLGAAFPAGKLSTLASIGRGATFGAAGSALSQGIGVAVGLQKKFNFSAVAAAGVAGGVGAGVGRALRAGPLTDLSARNIAANAATSAAGAIANAATRSLINGTDFGDNMMAALPDIIGSTIGNLIAGAAAGNGESHFAGEEDQSFVGGGDMPGEAGPAAQGSLTPAETAALGTAGLPASRIAEINAALEAQTAAAEVSPSASLANSRRRAILRLIANGNDPQYDQLKALNARLGNAVIDTDGEVLAVRQQIARARLSSDGTTLTGFALDQRGYEFAVHLGIWGRVHGSDVVPSAATNDSQVANVTNAVNALPPISTADLSASPTLRRFAHGISGLTDDARLAGSQLFEKVVRISRAGSGFAVTAIRGGGSQGSRINDLINANTAAVLHIHYDGANPALVQTPAGSDHSPVHRKNVPSFVYGGADNRLYEVYRHSQKYRFGRVMADGSLQGTQPFN
jgi:hypothetical protein